jgi:hypothetical protein
MKISEVSKLLSKGFGEMYKPLEFKKWKYGYKKEVGSFSYTFGFSSSNMDNSFPSTFYYRLGCFTVGNILNLITPLTELDTQIIGIGQADLFEAKKISILKYDIYNEEDANKMVSEVSKYFIEQALPYLESVSSIEKLEKITNSELNPWKKSTGLILAKLVNNPSYESLKIKYRELLKDWSDWDKQELEKVISFLDSHSQEELLKIAETA